MDGHYPMESNCQDLRQLPEAPPLPGPGRRVYRMGAIAMNANTQIANTILDQLGGTGRIAAMTGAKNFMVDGPGVSFKFPNRDCKRPNWIKVTLDPSDTYTVTMGRIVKYALRSSSTVNGIYCDGLVELFENATGLRLSL